MYLPQRVMWKLLPHPLFELSDCSQVQTQTACWQKLQAASLHGAHQLAGCICRFCHVVLESAIMSWQRICSFSVGCPCQQLLPWPLHQVHPAALSWGRVATLQAAPLSGCGSDAWPAGYLCLQQLLMQLSQEALTACRCPTTRSDL